MISRELYHLDEKILKGCIKILLYYGITTNSFLMLLTAVVGFYDLLRDMNNSVCCSID